MVLSCFSRGMRSVVGLGVCLGPYSRIGLVGSASLGECVPSRFEGARGRVEKGPLSGVFLILLRSIGFSDF